MLYYSLDSLCCVRGVFSKGALFFWNFASAWNLNKNAARQRRAMSIANGIPPSCTPAACYVFSKAMLHL